MILQQCIGGDNVNMNTKRLLFTVLILGTLLSVLTATTVMASANDTPCGQQVRDQDRVQDRDQLSQNDGSCPDTCDGLHEQHQHQHGLECPDGCDSASSMNRARYRYQFRHCKNQGS